MPSTDAGQLASTWVFEAIGTRWSIDTERPLDDFVRREISCCIDDFDRIWSRFRPASTVGLMARTPGTYDFGPRAGSLLDLYEDLYRRSAGAVTPLVGNMLELWGYGADYALAGPKLSTGPSPSTAPVTVPRWEDVITRRGNELTSSAPVTFDVGAAGKGYLVDLVTDIMQRNNITNGVVDASGDLRHIGEGVQRVGLEHPKDPSRVIGVARITGNALCASAVNRRAWGDGLHHVVDPRSGEPAREVIATWVIAPTAMVADGIATALFFVPPRLLVGLDFSFVRMLADGRVEYSRNLDGELFR